MPILYNNFDKTLQHVATYARPGMANEPLNAVNNAVQRQPDQDRANYGEEGI
jgi:hypothetical protein